MRLKIGNYEMRAIIDAAHGKFIQGGKFPEGTKETQVYLFLHGLDRLLRSKGIEVPFEVPDLDAPRSDIGGLDDIG
jgi:hypothetical protein